MADVIFGLDVGWSSSYTALVSVQRYSAGKEGSGGGDRHFVLRSVVRFPLSTPPKQVLDAIPGLISKQTTAARPEADQRAAVLEERLRHAKQQLARAKGSAAIARALNSAEAWQRRVEHERRVHSTLAVDASNDRSFAEHLPSRQELGARVVPVVITSGDAESATGQHWRVSRGRLINDLRHLIGFGRLHLTPDVPGVEELVDELQGLEEHITAAANLTYRTREGQRDDLVMALAMACWVGGKVASGSRGVRVIHTPSSVALRMGRH